MRRLWISKFRQQPIMAIPFSAFQNLLLHDGVELAASIAFNTLLALFPFLFFLFTLSGLVSTHETLDLLLEFLFRLVPIDVAQTLTPVVVQVLTEPRGGLLPVSLLFAVWAASSALDAVRLSLNHAYGIVELRSMWRLKTQSVVFVMLGGGFLVVVTFLMILGPFLWRIVEGVLHLHVESTTFWLLGQYFIGAALISFVSALLHLLLPMHRLQLREVLPGSIASSILWLVTTAVFTLYLSRLADYGATYGTLGGVAITMLFFDVSAAIFIYGAELNVAFARWRSGTLSQQEPTSAGGPHSGGAPTKRALSAETASPFRREKGSGELTNGAIDLSKTLSPNADPQLSTTRRSIR